MKISTTFINVKKIIIGIFLLLLLSYLSCSRINYRTNGEIPVYLTPQKGHDKNFVVDKSVDFYLFGFIPERHAIFLDMLGKQEGFNEISKLEIYERTSVKDFLWMIISLGCYTPRTVVVSGWGTKN
ncbi:MAG: hypothetical protein HQK49_20220 [Oligoflexia bacterium]|nr:hypothetical protein [Oligoflexia bacterium]